LFSHIDVTAIMPSYICHPPANLKEKGLNTKAVLIYKTCHNYTKAKKLHVSCCKQD